MAPPPPTRAQIQRLVTVSTLLHGLIVVAHVIGLVFTVLVVSPLEQKLPTRRLVMFGTVFILYLVVKAFQVSVPITWFALKSCMDEASLLLGGLSLVCMVMISSVEFAYYVAVPAYAIVVVGWILSRTGQLERFFTWVYVKYFELKKCFQIWSRVRVLKSRTSKFIRANSSYKDACGKITHKLSVEEFQILEVDVELKKKILLSAIEAVVEAQDEIERCRRVSDLRIEQASIVYDVPEV